LIDWLRRVQQVQREEDGEVTLKLADFGLAMEVVKPIYMVCGTPTYVAPEILSHTGRLTIVSACRCYRHSARRKSPASLKFGVARWPSGQRARLRRRRAWVQIAAATLSGNSLRQTVHTHRAPVYQAAKLVAALLRVAGVTAGLAESNGNLPPGL